jgi:hypothetical protein
MCTRTTTNENASAKIQKKLGAKFDYVVLCFRHQMSQILLMSSCSQLVLLHIKSLAGSLPSLTLSPEATVIDLKRSIQSSCPESAGKRLRLMTARTTDWSQFAELTHDSSTLSKCGITDGTEINVVIENLYAGPTLNQVPIVSL